MSVKAQKSAAQKPNPRKRSRDSSSPSVHSSTKHYVLVPLRSLSFELETVVTTYFLDFYAPDSPFEYLPQHWSRIADDETVRAAVLPTAIAAFAYRFRHPELLEQALIYYSAALTSTNNALCNRELVTLDSTLLNVLLLSMFEALTFRGRSSPDSWIMHVNGLAVILRMRGKERLDDVFGRRLFHHASSHILANCAQKWIPVPPYFSRLQQYARSLHGTDDPGVKMGILLDGLAFLRANMKGMLATKAVRKILELDSIAKSILRSLNSSFSGQVYNTTEYFSDIRDDLPRTNQPLSRTAARQSNTIRMFRIALAEWTFCAFQTDLRGIILDHPAPDDPLYAVWDQLPDKALVSFQDTMEQILSSIPRPGESLHDSRNGTVRSLIWPLAVVATSELCPAYAKLLIIDQLKDLGSRYEIEQSKAAATMIEEGVNIEGW